jgi:ATP-binding cassette, subfamily C, bacterial
MLNERTTRFIAYFMRAYPRRTALLVVLLILSGLAEGIGVITILPLLEFATTTGEAQGTGVGQSVARALAALGLPLRVEVFLGVIVLGLVLKAVFLLLAMKQVGYTVSHVGTDLRLSLIRALLHTRWSYFTRQRTGRFANAISTEANQAGNAYASACSMMAAVVQAGVYLAAALVISWRIALVSLVGGGVVVLLLSRLVALTRQAGMRKTKLNRSLIARITDALQGIKPLKAMRREAHLQRVLESEARAINAAQERTVLASEALRISQEPLLAVMLAVVLYAALVFGNLPFGTVLLMGFLFYRLAFFISQAQVFYQGITVGEASFWSMRESIETAEAEREALPAGRAAPTLQRELRMEGVSFGYDDRPVLRDLDLRVAAGQFVALIGPSGAGKTTIVDLLVGLHRPDRGRVLIDDVPLEEIDLAAWRERIGYVPQEMFLFHESVYHNVSLGDDTISRDEVREALITAGASEFVDALPEGLDTVLGERGSLLSGGQRQRIAIARAIVRRPTLLILDEVTTSLDPETEARLCASIEALRGRVTVISISHQPVMAEMADLVVRLRDGRFEAVANPDPPILA